VSVVRLQQLSDAMECWLQSNVKDVVRLIARLLWGTKVGGWAGGVSCLSPTGSLSQAHSAWDRAVEPMAKRQRGPDSVDEGGSSADEESSSAKEESST
jgi:hypothetical protein